MKNIMEAKLIFDKKLTEIQNQTQPAHIGHNLKEIVIYEKLLEMQEQLNKLEKQLLNS